jgi:hypothetical protein
MESPEATVGHVLVSLINSTATLRTRQADVAGRNINIPSPHIGGTIQALLYMCIGNGTARRVGPLRCQAACAVSLSSGAPTC